MTKENTPKPTPKRPGRRPKDGNEISRAVIVECAIKIAKSESLREVNMVRVAKELGVVPGLIHYHLGSRDALISAVINSAFRERICALPALTGDWREDIKQFAYATFESYQNWPGLATYILTENKFRLFQKTDGRDVDYGLVFFDHTGRILKSCGLNAIYAAVVYHLFMLLIAVLAAEKENRQSPSAHKNFIIEHLRDTSGGLYPGAEFLSVPFANLNTDTSFESGIRVVIGAIERCQA